MGIVVMALRSLLFVTLAIGVYSKFFEKNHFGQDTLAGCDPDYGWSDGADGSGKCYQLVHSFDYSTCGSDAGFGSYGMSWFNAMNVAIRTRGILQSLRTKRNRTRSWST